MSHCISSPNSVSDFADSDPYIGIFSFFRVFSVVFVFSGRFWGSIVEMKVMKWIAK